ncbi:unnamed protein product [Sphagnum troendelagicum]|uniref:ACT domain-containing protein n=1 Tax=Sphagnum troendelagicum TaxID=128251 RepID=A0ABP0UXS1_9BRYO
MRAASWPYFDPDYESLSLRINPPRVVIDNDSHADATLVKVNSANKHGILLEVVQELTDLDLSISKAYIASDGGWFMDVFHVTDQQGNKIWEADVLDNIHKALVTRKSKVSAELSRCAAGKFMGAGSIAEHTVIELTGTERPGLLSEIFAVLTEMNCRVHASEFWTHNRRVACMVYITDEDTSGPIHNVKKLVAIKEKLHLVMQGDNDETRVARTNVAEGATHTERRLHQLMLADKDYEDSEQLERSKPVAAKDKPTITVQTSRERGYSVINVRCIDRPKLLFDTVCTLTDMQYVVFHATATLEPASGPWAVQEFHIRQMDGQVLSPDAEEKVKKCLEAAIERRSSKGLRLELCTGDRVGLLSDVTRIFRENGLSVTSADVSTHGDKAMDVFYVADPSGKPVDKKTVETITRNYPILGVKETSSSTSKSSKSPSTEQVTSPLSNFLKSSERFFQGITSGWKTSTVA